jgi:NTE family protein
MEKTALVLSAGAFFGAYQAGVWKELCARFSPDLVVGSSAGALNGWAIAGGCDPDDLIRDWLDPANAKLMKPHFPLAPWRGVFDSAALERRVCELTSRYRPRVPFGAVLVQVPRLKTVLVQSATAKHLIATCSIPLGYRAVRIDGRHYVDGGFMSILPLWAAREMGATRAVAVMALPEAPRWFRATMGRFRERMGPPQGLAGLDVRLIAPSIPPGPWRHLFSWNPARAKRYIELGRRDADAVRLFDS